MPTIFYYLQERFGFFFIYFILLEKTALLLSEVQGGEERILEIELFNLVAPAVLAGSSLTGTQVQQHRQVMKNVALQHFSVNNKAHLFCVSKTLHAAHISNSVNLKIIQKSKSLFNQQDIPDWLTVYSWTEQQREKELDIRIRKAAPVFPRSKLFLDCTSTLWMLKELPKEYFYDCIVCIAHLGIKLMMVAVVHESTCSFCLTARFCMFLMLFQGCVCCHHTADIKSGVKEQWAQCEHTVIGWGSLLWYQCLLALVQCFLFGMLHGEQWTTRNRITAAKLLHFYGRTPARQCL